MFVPICLYTKKYKHMFKYVCTEYKHICLYLYSQCNKTMCIISINLVSLRLSATYDMFGICLYNFAEYVCTSNICLVIQTYFRTCTSFTFVLDNQQTYCTQYKHRKNWICLSQYVCTPKSTNICLNMFVPSTNIYVCICIVRSNNTPLLS